MQPEVQNIVELVKQRAARFGNTELNSKHEFKFQLVAGDFLIFVNSVQNSGPVRMSVGVGWSVKRQTRDWEEGHREVQSHRFAFVDGAWIDIVSEVPWSDDDIADWAVNELQDWIRTDGKQ